MRAPAFAPLNIDPGNAGAITVTFRPDAAKGTKVTGWLHVDDTTLSNDAGDELAYVYYDYTSTWARSAPFHVVCVHATPRPDLGRSTS